MGAKSVIATIQSDIQHDKISSQTKQAELAILNEQYQALLMLDFEQGIQSYLKTLDNENAKFIHDIGSVTHHKFETILDVFSVLSNDKEAYRKFQERSDLVLQLNIVIEKITDKTQELVNNQKYMGDL